MSQLSVAGLCKRYDRQAVLRGAALEVPEGSITALLGASGCGKTTLLRLVAGFDRADSGQISIGGQMVAAPGLHVPPERRRVGYVPQEGALFPHLTVAANVGYGLSRAERRSGRVEQVLALTGLQEFAARYPHALSGGQQQRTALARALAPRPRLVMLDEPFNALDIELRRSLCQDVTAAIRRAGATAVLVTHDPQEAFASADRLAVMRDGLVAQCDAPERVYHAPLSPEIAALTGAALMVDAALTDGVAQTCLGPIPLLPGHPLPSGPASALIRPEQIVLQNAGPGVPARITGRAFRGDHTLVTADVGALAVQVRVADASALGDAAVLRVGGTCVAFARG